METSLPRRQSMKNYLYAGIIVLTACLISVVPASAQINPGYGADRQTRTLLNRLSTEVATFQGDLQRRQEWNSNSNVNGEDRLSELVSTFSNSINSLRTSVNSRDNSSDEMASL